MEQRLQMARLLARAVSALELSHVYLKVLASTNDSWLLDEAIRANELVVLQYNDLMQKWICQNGTGERA